MKTKTYYKIRNKETGDFLIRVPQGYYNKPEGYWSSRGAGRIWYIKKPALDAKAKLPAALQEQVEVVEFVLTENGVVG